RISDRSLRVAVVGVGYAGLPVAVALARAGFETTALDRDPERVQALSEGRSYLSDVSGNAVGEQVRAGRLRATEDPSALKSADAVIVCVPTPLGKTRDPDIRHVIEATEAIVRHQHEGMLIVLESTSYPGTTRELLVPRLTRGRYRLGESVFVAFSPERIDPGNPTFRLENTPKVIGGACATSLRVASALYATFVERLVAVSSPEVAETAKLLENTFRAVNVALVNELALMSAELGVDAREVIEAAATKPFGYMPFYPGPGLGGHCIPVDPLYLSWRMRRVDRRARFVELADAVNRSMPAHVVERVTEALNDRSRPLRGSRILVYGVAYKPDVADTRESPGVAILSLLARRGALVSYSDPFVARLRTPDFELESTALDRGFEGWDLVVIATDHAALDRERLVADASLVVDARGALRGVPSRPGTVYGL
ncbi:MAG TPA: nucleotide sugar dehydrogenase, partial [Polyangiaceae bacterium]|nr:nucleotide sugar dehydrogenase [Polyangiaceae bacterium]